MIEIAHARPWPAPPLIGVSLRAAAHRISVEVGPVEQPTLAVYVPVRHTDSRPAILAGGRVFPGVHVPARIVIGTTLGLSPGRQPTQLEAVEMFPAQSEAQLVELELLESAFLSSFHSAVQAETLLMTDVDVTWQRSQHPA